MKVHLENTIRSRGIERVVAALEEYAPAEIDFVPADQADIVVIQVNGRLEHLKRKIAAYRKPYAIVQHAFRSTMNPDPEDWADVWNNAVLVWSHHDLPVMENLYRSPLGVSKVFHRQAKDRKYLVCTSGLSYLTESVRECILAAKGIGRVLHLGPDISRGHDHVDCVSGISDRELADLYRQCHYVSGLRRIEGFELPAAEGVLCGATPVLFEKEHYRAYFFGLGEFIREGSREEVLQSLRTLFQKTPVVTEFQTKMAEQRFDWPTIIHKFYGHLAARH